MSVRCAAEASVAHAAPGLGLLPRGRVMRIVHTKLAVVVAVTMTCAGCTAQSVGRSDPTVPATTNTQVTKTTPRQTSSAPQPADGRLEFRLVEAVRATREGLPPSSTPTSTVNPPHVRIRDPYTWAPTQTWRRAFDAFDCPAGRVEDPLPVAPDQPLILCDDQLNIYLTGPVLLSGGVEEATAIPPGSRSSQWTVRVELDAGASTDFADITTMIASSSSPPQLAITDGSTVISAPTVSEPIPSGTVEISAGGNGFDEQEARELAERINP